MKCRAPWTATAIGEMAWWPNAGRDIYKSRCSFSNLVASGGKWEHRKPDFAV